MRTKLAYGRHDELLRHCTECAWPIGAREAVVALDTTARLGQGDEIFCDNTCALRWYGKERRRIREAIQACIHSGDCPSCGSDLVHWSGTCPCGAVIGWRANLTI